MKKILLLLAVVFTVFFVNAQSTANYAFSTNTTGSLALDIYGNTVDMTTGTSTAISAGQSGAASVQYPIGFDFWFLGGRQTLFNVTGNGLVSFNAVIASTASNVASSSGARLAPFNIGTGATNMATSSTGKVHYKMQGTAPNRVLIVEWLNMSVNATSSTADATFQARMYETTGVVEFVYGAMNAVTGGPFTVARAGISSNTTANTYHTIDIPNNVSYTTTLFNNTINNGVITNLNSAADGIRRVYRYIPTIPAAPTGLNATAVTETGLTLNWTDNTTDETNFAIYRSNDGGATYNFITTVGANVITSAQTFLTPSTSYMYRVFAVREILSTATSVTQATNAGGNIVSTGAGGIWSATTTWVGGVVPQSFDNVTIADGATVTISNTGNVCFNLTVGQGASGILEFGSGGTGGLVANGDVTIAAGGTFTAGVGGLFLHTLGIGGTSAASRNGNLINNGTFDMNTANGVTTTFFGNLNGSISGIGATTDFYVLVVNKGANQTDATLDVTVPITIGTPTSGTVPRLTITTGTCRISSATVATPYFGNQTVTATNGRLWLNNAGASLQCVGTGVSATGSGSPTVTGELRIDNGLFGYGQGNNTFTFTSGSGILRMSGGTLNMFGAISFPSSISTQLIMTGGTINVDPQNITNLTTGTALFSIGASTTVNLTGGTLNIIDPHNAAGGTAWSYASGSAKLITSGFTLNIGDGVSGTASTAGNTSGFGISGVAVGLNMVINNRTDLSTTRMARLVAATTVTTLTLNANSYLFTGSSTTAAILTVRGNVVNNGTIAGSEPSGTQAIGTLYFNGQTGSGTQTLSGSGTFSNNGTVSIENYGTGVVFSNANLYKANRINMFTGSFNVGANFTLGNSSATTLESPVIQFGSGSATLAAATFTTFPTLDETELPRSLFYSEALGAHTMGNNNEIGTGAQTLHILLLSDIDGLTIPSNRTITVGTNLTSGTLQMGTGSGNINLSGGTLTLGASATFPGTLSYTQGLIQNGSFKRWYPIAGLPIVQGGTSIGYYPMGTTNTVSNRNVWVYFSNAAALTTGGTITVTHANPGGGLVTIPSFLDGGVNVDRRSSDNWTVVPADGITLGAFTASLSLNATNVAVITTLADCRLINATSAVATSVNASGSVASPILNRSTMTLADLTNTFYFGAAAANVSSVYTSITSGNWGDNGTWDVAGAPSATDNVVISSGHTVTVAGATTVGNNLTIVAGGILTANANTLALTNNITNGGTINIGGGTITVGPQDNSFCNRTVTNNGILSVTSGTFNIAGNLIGASGITATFNQSGGNINVDGNAAGVSANSVAASVPLVTINSALGTVNGGTMTIVDPHANTTASRAFSYSVTTTNFNWAGHTLQIGNGVSTDVGGATNGFELDGFVGSGRLLFGNVIVNSGNGTNRWAASSTATGNGVWLGNLTINANSEFRDGSATNFFVSGNIVNNGTLSNQSATINLTGWNTASNVSIPNSLAQTISGAGIFRNNLTVPTANFTALTINNTNTSGVTFSTGITTPTISGAITVTDGKVNANDLSLTGTSAQTVALTAPTSSINVTNLTLNNTLGATLSGSGFLNVTGVYTKTAGILAAGGRLTLKSSLAGTARVAQLSSGDITGTVNVERFFAGGAATGTPGVRGFRFIAHPFTTNPTLTTLIAGGLSVTGTGGATNGFTANPNGGATNNASAFSYNPAAVGAGTILPGGGTDPGWTAYTNANTGLWNKMQGIRVLFRGTGTQGLDGNNVYTVLPLTLSITGAVNIGTQNFALPATLDVVNPKWSLVGNPYPSQIEVRTLLNNKYNNPTPAAGNIGATAYVFNPTKVGSSRGGYDMIDISTAGSYILPTYGVVLVQNTIATTHNIPFAETDKATGAPSLSFRTTNANNALVLDMQDANGIELDKMYIRFNDKSTNSFENRDGGKMLNEYAIYTLTPDNSLLAIDSRPEPTQESIIPMGVQSVAGKNFVLKASELELPVGVKAYLKDKFLNTETSINSTNFVYAFSTTNNAASVGNARFEILFKKGLPVLPTVTTFSVKLSPNPAKDMVTINFSNVEQANTTITFVSAEGKIVKTIQAGNVQTGVQRVNVNDLAKGIYYVTLNNGTDKKTEKLVIQ